MPLNSSKEIIVREGETEEKWFWRSSAAFGGLLLDELSWCFLTSRNRLDDSAEDFDKEKEVGGSRLAGQGESSPVGGALGQGLELAAEGDAQASGTEAGDELELSGTQGLGARLAVGKVLVKERHQDGSGLIGDVPESGEDRGGARVEEGSREPGDAVGRDGAESGAAGTQDD
jgi:hypothetical protein